MEVLHIIISIFVGLAIFALREGLSEPKQQEPIDEEAIKKVNHQHDG